jgi:transcriptional regulator with XRE-family HTH domain
VQSTSKFLKIRNTMSDATPHRIDGLQTLGAIVRARRKAQALRIDDAAALCGVSVDLLSRLENGKGAVRLDKLLAVLDGLGLALTALPKDHAPTPSPLADEAPSP